MKKQLIFVLILAALILCVPVTAAGNFTNADTWLEGSENLIANFNHQESVVFDLTGQNMAVTMITMDGLTPGRIDFILTMGDGSTHIGHIEYNRDLVVAEFEIGMDGNTDTWDGLDNFLQKAYISTYATNQDTNEDGILLYESWFTNLFELEHYVFSPDPYIRYYPIIKVEIVSDNPISTTITYASTAYVQENISEGTGSGSWLSYLGQLIEFLSNIFQIIPTILYIFYYLFVTRFFELVILYEIIILAYSAAHSKDAFSFSKKVIKYNVAFFAFWIAVVESFVNIFASIIGALKFW
jgi:hypothetical protein